MQDNENNNENDNDENFHDNDENFHEISGVQDDENDSLEITGVQDDENEFFNETTGVQDDNDNNHENYEMITTIMRVTAGMITMKMVAETILTMLNLLMKLPLTSLVLETLPQFIMTTMTIHTMNTWRQHMKQQLRT